MKKLISKVPSASGLKSKIDGLMFIISVVILIGECIAAFKKGYELLKDNDKQGKTSNSEFGSTGADSVDDTIS
jgi:hypothetical protein